MAVEAADEFRQWYALGDGRGDALGKTSKASRPATPIMIQHPGSGTVVIR
jgi:hypothetical protein